MHAINIHLPWTQKAATPEVGIYTFLPTHPSTFHGMYVHTYVNVHCVQ